MDAVSYTHLDVYKRQYMDSAMAEFFKTYLAMSDEELREHRYQRFRRM